MAALVRQALATLLHEGLRAWSQRQWLWLRKRWYYAYSRPRMVRALAAGTPHTAIGSSPSVVLRGVSAPLRVCYIASIEELLSKRYRVDNMVERLRLAGAQATAVYEIDAVARAGDALSCDLLIFQRVPASAELRALVAQARARGIALAYDADDYVFEPTIEPYVAALRGAPAAKVEEWRRTVQGCRDLLLLCDTFIGSTAFLAEKVKTLGRPGVVIPNGVNARQLQLAEAVLARRGAAQPARQKTRDGYLIRIGYLAGTPTHQRDLALVVPALVRILREYPRARLLLRGLVSLPPDLAPFAARVERRPFVSWERLVAATAQLDIALAPLEGDNPFTEGKSALKYVECGLVEVPVVASSTAEFRGAIRAGETGLLATTADEWYDALRRLIGDSAFRHATGAAARQDVLARCTPAAQCAGALATLERIAGRGEGERA